MILIYGANGYTGQLIARFAAQYDLKPVLAGRSEEKIRPLAASLGLDYLVMGLNNASSLERALQPFTLVIHAAGPYEHTATQMVEACMRTKTHYIDINGDISVFEMLRQRDNEFKHAGIMVLPGAGFDVVPTDCLALSLKMRMPDAVSLKLAFATIGGGLSHGTATTMATRLGEGGAVRKNGKIVKRPLGSKGMWVDFGRKRIFVMSIPWGDVSTAFFTTGIGDIETYTAISPMVYRTLKMQFLFNWILRSHVVRKAIMNRIDSQPAGPADSRREKALTLVWGEVVNTKGERVTARLTTPDGYTLTAHSCLIIAKKILQNNYTAGYQTPASMYGKDLILEVPGVLRD